MSVGWYPVGFDARYPLQKSMINEQLVNSWGILIYARKVLLRKNIFRDKNLSGRSTVHPFLGVGTSGQASLKASREKQTNGCEDGLKTIMEKSLRKAIEIIYTPDGKRVKYLRSYRIHFKSATKSLSPINSQIKLL